jgi:hypothetical protein
VIYRPDRKLPEWHDRGHQPILPGIVTKVWSSGAVNLRVADVPAEDSKVDVKVFLDHNAKDGAAFVYVPTVPYGQDMGCWEWPK